MWVVATAGHVDHGKSTLIRALTGTEPDRWAEEKRRGLTIGLGFAWTSLPALGEVAFVDVPGHERFVATMLAGAGPVPAVLFVVAADGGWMPQSAEHLAALAALGVEQVVLAVTRADLADPAPVLADARARLRAGGIGAVEAVAVSGRTGAGLDGLRAALGRMLRALPTPDPDADLRWWVDRSFSITGAGTVVTGTLTAGTLRVGEELVLASTGERVSVRGLQALERDVSSVTGTARVAANLRGVDRSSVRAGDALLAPDRWLTTSEVDVLVSDSALPERATLHLGSAAVPVRVRPLDERVARLRLARPLPLRVGDRALLRDPGAHRIVARVDVLDPRPPELFRRGAARQRARELADPTPERLAEAFLRRRKFVPETLFSLVGLPPAGQAVAGGLRADPVAWAGALERVGAVLREWAGAHPLADGMPVSAVAEALTLPDTAVAQALLVAAGQVVERGHVVVRGRDRLPAAVESSVARLEADLAEAPFVAPDADRLRELGLGPRELAAAVRAGRLCKVAEGIVLLPDACARAAEALAGIEQPFTVSRARQAWGTTRRVAVPLLELLDRERITEPLSDGTRRLR